MNPIEFYEAKLLFETDSWDLSELLKTADSVIVVDTRSAQAYAAEHIPGALNIPHRTMSAETTKHLDKSKLIVTYCDGIGCNASTKGALNMSRLGFTVKELLGGLDWWKRDGYATDAGVGKETKAGFESDSGHCSC
ncbi:MAG: rhodanese-like domain-containing protein [Gammaproteobacteria bacterium]|nr:rhodanese-like domain-containing protein [Gammaproteobacteria bacterium]MDH5799772.1 rhodanese-like domain-containing protein [Gammaproteobacteria bacterium]